MKGQEFNLKGYIILFFLLSSITLPSINFFGLGLYLTTIFSPLLFMYILVINKVSINKFFIIIFFLGIMVFVSSLYSNSIGISTHNYRNYIESIKYLQFLPYLMSLKLIKDANVYIKAIDTFTFFFIAIFLMQWLNLFGLKEFVVSMYLSDDSSHAEYVLNNWRLSLTGSGPNEGAAIATFFLIYNLNLFLEKFSLRYLLLSGTLLLSVFLTQSRTALIGASLTILIVIFLSKGRLFYKLFFISFSSIFLFLLFNSLDLEYVKLGFELAQTGDNSSVNIRLDRLNDALSYFKKSPIFGYGPAKNELSTIVDSEYVLIIQRYGILGACLFGYLIFSLLKYGYSNRRYIAGKILFSYTVLTLVIMFTNNAYSGYQLMSITVVLLMWVSSSKRGNNDSSSNIRTPSF